MCNNDDSEAAAPRKQLSHVGAPAQKHVLVTKGRYGTSRGGSHNGVREAQEGIDGPLFRSSEHHLSSRNESTYLSPLLGPIPRRFCSPLSHI